MKIHNEMKKCTVKRMTEENSDVSYPTLKSVHQAVMDTERYPSWSVSTFRQVMLQMGIKFETKSEADRAILIEDEYIIEWRDKFLKNMISILPAPCMSCFNFRAFFLSF